MTDTNMIKRIMPHLDRIAGGAIIVVGIGLFVGIIFVIVGFYGWLVMLSVWAWYWKLLLFTPAVLMLFYGIGGIAK